MKNQTLIDFVLPKIESRLTSLIKDILLIFSFSILTGIFAKLKIEIGPIPITMQTLAVLLSGVILGSKRGAFSQITYLILGLAGMPWFSRGGGLSYVLSPTFGYIVGFVFCAYLVGFLCERGWNKSLKTSILAMFFGNIILYIPGILWLAKFVSWQKVLAIGLYPFIPGDILKLFLATAIFSLSWKLAKVARQISRS